MDVTKPDSLNKIARVNNFQIKFKDNCCSIIY